MLKQLLRLTGLLWLLLLLVLCGFGWLGELRNSALIAFLSEPERSVELFLADSEAALSLRMTDNEAHEEELRWSPDGRYLYFDRWDVPDAEVWLLDTADWTLEEIRLGEFSDAFWYSPDELIVAVNRTGAMKLINVETLATSPYTEKLPCEACFPTLGANRMTAYDLELSITNEELHVTIDTTAYLSTDFEPNTDLQPWSPDGFSFLFINALQGQPDMYLSAAEGGIARRLTNSPTPEQMPRWSSDGQKISYISYEDGNAEIYVMELATGYHYNVSLNENRDHNPVWQPVP
jgi:Tol biopolymer transport system component